MEFTKADLVNLRNLSLALHASAGHLITVPTDGAIQGSADADATRIAMMAFINPILQDVVNITLALNQSVMALHLMIDNAHATPKS